MPVPGAGPALLVARLTLLGLLPLRLTLVGRVRRLHVLPVLSRPCGRSDKDM